MRDALEWGLLVSCLSDGGESRDGEHTSRGLVVDEGMTGVNEWTCLRGEEGRRRDGAVAGNEGAPDQSGSSILGVERGRKRIVQLLCLIYE